MLILQAGFLWKRVLRHEFFGPIPRGDKFRMKGRSSAHINFKLKINSENGGWTYFSSMKIADVYAGISTRPLRKKLRYLSPASSAVLSDRP